MNLRLEAILKKEKNLYKDITGNLKGKNFAELNGGLAETIAKLLERKALIEQLNQEVLADEAREALYARIEDNNKYFVEEVDREDINNQFMQADDSYAKSAEWQNLHMAFLSTASVSSYKAVDKFNNNFEDLKKRKEKIDGLAVGRNNDIAALKAKVPGVDTTNAKQAYERFQNEFKNLDTLIYNNKQEWDEWKNSNSRIEDEIKKLNEEKERLSKQKEIYEKAYKMVQQDPKYFNMFLSEDLGKIIKAMNDGLLKERDDLAAQNAAFKEYFEYHKTKVNDPRTAFLDKFEEIIDELRENGYSDDISIEELGGKLREKSNLVGDEAYKYAKKFDDYVDQLTELYYRNDPGFAKAKEDRDKAKKEDRRIPQTYFDYIHEITGKTLEGIDELRENLFNEITAEMMEEMKVVLHKFDEKDQKLINQYLDKKAKVEKKVFDELPEIQEKNAKQEEKELDEMMTHKVNGKPMYANRGEAEAVLRRQALKTFTAFVNTKLNIATEEILGEDAVGKYKLSGEKILITYPDRLLKSEIQKLDNMLKDKEKELQKYDLNQLKIDSEKDKAFADKQSELYKQLGVVKEQRDLALKLMNPKENFKFATYEEDVNKQYDKVPKLDVKAVMEAKRVAGNDLLKMVNEYKGNHKNSPEFDAMVSSMLYVTNWGTDFTMPTTYSNAPKTFAEAITQLKENCKKYVDAKNDQKRPFPSKMRHLRFQIAKAFDMYADTQEESLKDFKTSEKVANSWNEYFASRGEKEILNEQNIDIATGISQQNNEPVLENEEDGMEM